MRRRSRQSADLTVVLATPSEDDPFDAWNRRALDEDIVWLPAGDYDGATATVGPLVIPRETACHECLVLRRHSTSGCAAGARRAQAEPSSLPPPGCARRPRPRRDRSRGRSLARRPRPGTSWLRDDDRDEWRADDRAPPAPARPPLSRLLAHEPHRLAASLARDRAGVALSSLLEAVPAAAATARLASRRRDLPARRDPRRDRRASVVSSVVRTRRR